MPPALREYPATTSCCNRVPSVSKLDIIWFKLVQRVDHKNYQPRGPMSTLLGLVDQLVGTWLTGMSCFL